MKSTPYTYLGLGLLLVSSFGCQQGTPAAEKSAAASGLMNNDFEASVGWNEAQEGSLTTAKAHSGRWSVQVQPATPFSYTFVRQLGQLDPKLTRSYQLKGWALRASTGSTASLVVQVNKSSTDTAKVFYGALPISDAVKSFDKWEAVSMPFALPATAAAGNVVKIYLWNDKATAPTYLDDLELVPAQ